MVAKCKNSKNISDLREWCASISDAKNQIWVGIDPGLNGALAFVSEDGSAHVIGTPTYKVKRGKKNKSEYDIDMMCTALAPLSGRNVIICQELTHAMPGNGNVSMYSFGRGHGLWEGAVSSMGIPLIFSLPQQWKKIYPSLLVKTANLDKKDKQKAKAESKKQAIVLAKNMFSQLENKLKKVSDDGKAEALLIANYCKLLSKGQIPIIK